MVANGLPDQDARARICVVEIEGLLITDRTDLTPRSTASPGRRRAQHPARPASPS
jgi:hypothetical protein